MLTTKTKPAGRMAQSKRTTVPTLTTATPPRPQPRLPPRPGGKMRTLPAAPGDTDLALVTANCKGCAIGDAQCEQTLLTSRALSVTPSMA